MGTKLTGAISLTKIPKDKIRSYTFKDGSVDKSVYIDIIPLKETDDKGNTHNVTIYADGKTIYLGRLKPKEFGKDTAKNSSTQYEPKNDVSFGGEDNPFPF